MAGFADMERLTYGPWQAIERMLARLVEHCGYKDVCIVGGPGEKGADIVCTVNGQRWVIQSKFRRSGQVDTSAAKEAIQALAAYDAEVAVAATNQTFSQAVYDYHEEKKKNGIDLRLWDFATIRKYFRKLPLASMAMPILRDYQSDAVDAVEQARAEGAHRGLIVMATGLGKSLVANQLVVNELERNPSQEILVLAHTTSLVQQLEKSAWAQLDKQCTTHLWTDGEAPTYGGGVVFATWQSITAELRRTSLAQRFGLVVVDEAHHGPSIAFSQMLEDITPNFLVGLTATPWRGDEIRLDRLFGQSLYNMDIVDGMQRGLLANVDYHMLTDGIDWSEIARMSRQGRTVRDLNERLILPDRDEAICAKFSEHFKALEHPRALVFCRSISHATRLQSILSAHGIPVGLVYGNMPRDQKFKNLSSFRAGTIECLLSVEMLNEGIDVPDVNMVAFLRVTHSRRIFVQQLGRGLRISSDKDRVLVLDFVADIRRVAAGLALNRTAAVRGGDPEVIRFRDGRIVQFENDDPATFFDEYLEDVAAIEDLDGGSQLRFPD